MPWQFQPASTAGKLAPSGGQRPYADSPGADVVKRPRRGRKERLLPLSLGFFSSSPCLSNVAIIEGSILPCLLYTLSILRRELIDSRRFNYLIIWCRSSLYPPHLLETLDLCLQYNCLLSRLPWFVHCNPNTMKTEVMVPQILFGYSLSCPALLEIHSSHAYQGSFWNTSPKYGQALFFKFTDRAMNRTKPTLSCPTDCLLSPAWILQIQK